MVKLFYRIRQELNGYWMLAMDVLTAALVLAFRQCVIKTVGWADGGSPTSADIFRTKSLGFLRQPNLRLLMISALLIISNRSFRKLA